MNVNKFISSSQQKIYLNCNFVLVYTILDSYDVIPDVIEVNHRTQNGWMWLYFYPLVCYEVNIFGFVAIWQLKSELNCNFATVIRVL